MGWTNYDYNFHCNHVKGFGQWLYIQTNLQMPPSPDTPSFNLCQIQYRDKNTSKEIHIIIHIIISLL